MSDLVRVLLVEDDEDDYILCRDLLSEVEGGQYELQWVATAEAAREAMHAGQFDVCLLDYRFGKESGLDLLREAVRQGCRAPLILVTGQGDHRVDIQAMQAGAADYLVKDQINGRLLERALRYAIARGQAEEALRESEERFRLMVEHVRDHATLMLGPDGRVMNWNAGAERMKGYAASEIVGRHFSCFYLPEEIESGRPDQALAVASTTGHFEDEGWRVRKDGSRFWANVVLSALKDESGRLRGFSNVTRDMTERMRLEEQLRQAQKMEAIGRLAGGVAHDFNNMLGAIVGYTDLLLHRFEDDEATRGILQEIMKAGERATGLTRQLLAFSRKGVVAPEVLDLSDVVEGMYKMLRRLIGEDIELVTVSDPDLHRVKADPSQIEQVIMNLAVNARDAMPEGGKLTIELRNGVGEGFRINTETRRHGEHGEATEGKGGACSQPFPSVRNSVASVPPCLRVDSESLHPYILLSVTDTGCGMDAATQSRIFEPFFTTKELGRGTGLGLATVYGIVQQSGGQIQVESQPENGTTFSVYLPAVESSELSRPVLHGGERSGRETSPCAELSTLNSQLSTNRTVLLVEDEPMVRRMVHEVLRVEGYTVLEAIQGDDALGMCQPEGPAIDLLLTDVMMPGMSGRELVERASALRPGMKVLFMSGYTDDAVVRHGVSDAEIAFIQKPFKPAELTQKVSEVLGP